MAETPEEAVKIEEAVETVAVELEGVALVEEAEQITMIWTYFWA